MKGLISVDVEGLPEASSFSPVDRLDELMGESKVPFSLFVTPAVVRNRPDVVQNWDSAGHSIGLHIHPGRMPGGDSDWLTDYGTDEIVEFVSRGVDTFESEIGISPTSFRAGRWEYSDELLRALSECGFQRDASLKSGEHHHPFERYGVGEYPLTTYSNAVLRLLMRRWTFQFIPMHLDAFLKHGLISLGFYLLTRHLLGSNRPYLMVSYHDYDLQSPKLFDRILRYQTYMQERTTLSTVEDLPRPPSR